MQRVARELLRVDLVKLTIFRRLLVVEALLAGRWAGSSSLQAGLLPRTEPPRDPGMRTSLICLPTHISLYIPWRTILLKTRKIYGASPAQKKQLFARMSVTSSRNLSMRYGYVSWGLCSSISKKIRLRTSQDHSDNIAGKQTFTNHLLWISTFSRLYDLVNSDEASVLQSSLRSQRIKWFIVRFDRHSLYGGGWM